MLFIQDAAYQSLLKSNRQQLHQQIAQVLEERFPEPERGSRNCSPITTRRRASWRRPSGIWQRAGGRAGNARRNVEAINHVTTALKLLKTLPGTPERDRQELMLQVALGPSLIATKGYGVPEVEHAYTRARELCHQIGATPLIFPVLWGLSVFYMIRAQHQTACEVGEQLLRLAQSEQDRVFLLPAATHGARISVALAWKFGTCPRTSRGSG